MDATSVRAVIGGSPLTLRCNALQARRYESVEVEYMRLESYIDSDLCHGHGFEVDGQTRMQSRFRAAH